MADLTAQRCVACSGTTPPLTADELADLRSQVSDEWRVGDGARLVRHFKFKSFAAAFQFAREIADIAEAEGHHPDLCLGWGYVDVALTTHAIKGLSRNDFIVAAKIDALTR
jgi:4a-hydroxytetrahydrobiopterin dehydratase